MNIEFYPSVAIDISYDEERIRKWIIDTIKKENYTPLKIHFFFVNDEELLAINKEFLVHDYYTDIITFDYSIPNSKSITGDIYISYDRIIENSQTQYQNLEKEFLRVIIHGILHLLGYKDKTKEESSNMRNLEEKYLSLY